MQEQILCKKQRRKTSFPLTGEIPTHTRGIGWLLEAQPKPVFLAAATLSAQLIFQIAIILSNRGTHFIIKIWREFFHTMNGPPMFQDLFKEFCLCLRTCCESAVGPKIFAAYRFVHVKNPFLNRKIIIIFQDSRG